MALIETAVETADLGELIEVFHEAATPAGGRFRVSELHLGAAVTPTE